MTTITLPADVEGPLCEAASKRGTSPELLAIESLRILFPVEACESTPNTAAPHSLFEFLAGHIGVISMLRDPHTER